MKWSFDGTDYKIIRFHLFFFSLQKPLGKSSADYEIWSWSTFIYLSSMPSRSRAEIHWKQISFYLTTYIRTCFVADTQFYKRLCPSLRSSVRRSVGRSWSSKKCENTHFRCCSHECLCVRVWVGWARVWMDVSRLCPAVCNEIVTPRHLLMVYLFKRLGSSQELITYLAKCFKGD